MSACLGSHSADSIFKRQSFADQSDQKFAEDYLYGCQEHKSVVGNKNNEFIDSKTDGELRGRAQGKSYSASHSSTREL